MKRKDSKDNSSFSSKKKDNNSFSSKKKKKTSKKETSSSKNQYLKKNQKDKNSIKKKSNIKKSNIIINKEKNNKKEKEKIQNSEKSRKDIHQFLDALIQPLNGTQIYKQESNESQSYENAQSTESSKKDNSELLFKIDEKTYKLTPKGILWAALDAYYKIGNDIDKFELFVKDILQSLSLLATGGTDVEVFGRDFNDFFELVVNMINTTGKMKEILDQNGIEFDVKKYLAGEGDLGNDDDVNDTNDDGKPKKSK